MLNDGLLCLRQCWMPHKQRSLSVSYHSYKCSLSGLELPKSPNFRQSMDSGACRRACAAPLGISGEGRVASNVDSAL